MIARFITARVVLNGTDITADLSPYRLGVTYQDVASGETDTLELDLLDRDGLFIADWYPPLGATLEVEFIRTNWQGDDLTERLDLGVFEVEEVTNAYPPSTCKIKANSCSQNSALRQVDQSRAWEDVKLSAIAKDIADAAQVTLVYEATDDPTIKRAEQAELSALAFLKKICADYGLALKVADEKLIIFDETTLEAQAAVRTITRAGVLSFRATTTLSEVYKSAEVSYKHGKKAEQYSATFDSGKAAGKVLKINQRVESQAEAERLARKKLREKNKDETKVDVTLVGDFDLLSGNVVELAGYGVYDGRYLIERATHRFGGGYECRLELRKCLEGY